MACIQSERHFKKSTCVCLLPDHKDLQCENSFLSIYSYVNLTCFDSFFLFKPLESLKLLCLISRKMFSRCPIIRHVWDLSDAGLSGYHLTVICRAKTAVTWQFRQISGTRNIRITIWIWTFCVLQNQRLINLRINTFATLKT